ncbi:hypothetical protein GALL_161940 [mine drainage metagenome]|uniref:General secretion pathway protein M n=1 Tax=mine drainage metagenome TaxID=410659 RepID=A0A1J5SIZ4_9ZZZZ
MKPGLTFRDLALIRGRLVLAMTLSLLGLSLVLVSLGLVQAARQSHGQALAQYRDAQRRLSEMRGQEQAIGPRLARYGELQKRGYLSQEDRLSWLEQIRRIQAQRGLSGLRFELAPRQPIDPGDAGIELLSSKMKLELQLLHEEDLLGFLADLHTAASAYTRLRSCRLERLPDGGRSQGATAQLVATCSIDWITVGAGK